MQWPLESHRRAWEGEVRKKRRQKMSIFPTDLWTEALSPVFVVALLELETAVLSLGWGRCVWMG